MSELVYYQQQEANLQILVQKLRAKGIPKPTVVALAVNSLHESYCNPCTIQGAINPGPPLAANGVNDGTGGFGLWQWDKGGAPNPVADHISGSDADWNWQIQYMIDFKEQWDVTGSWFGVAGLPDPLPEVKTYDEFMQNTHGYDAVALTQGFIGYWERPDYTAGTGRYNSASEEVAEVQPYVDRYWGSNPDNNDGNSAGDGNPPPPDVDPNPSKPDAGGDNSTSLSDELRKLVDKYVNQFLDAMKADITMLNNGVHYYSNSKIKMQQTYTNHYKVDFSRGLIEAITGMIDGEKNPPAPKPPKPDPEEPVKPVPKPDPGTGNMDDIVTWCQNNLGKAFNYPEAHPGDPAPQCVDLIKAISIYCLEGNPLAQALSYDDAQFIYAHDLPEGWEHVEGNMGDDADAEAKWNQLPNGAIVFFWYSTYGHVGVKAGEWCNVYNQNYNRQGYITQDNIVSWIAGGAGYIGAWVRK